MFYKVCIYLLNEIFSSHIMRLSVALVALPSVRAMKMLVSENMNKLVLNSDLSL